MGRKSYSITRQDLKKSILYLETHYPELEEKLSAISLPAELQSLINENLSPIQFARLRSSIRMTKSRDKKKLNKQKDVNITLSKTSHKILSDFCNEEKLTLSEAINRYFAVLLKMTNTQRTNFIKKWY